MTLFINCCIRDHSRTLFLAKTLLKRLGGEYEELNLYQEDLLPLDKVSLKDRTELLESCDYSSPIFTYAKQFAAADVIVIAAPYWDLSFPAPLKIYLENIYVTGIVSHYNSNGRPEGLCRAKKLYYVVTAGGPYMPDYSFGYIQTMATQFFGIPEAILIKADMLDIDGSHPEAILNEASVYIHDTVVPLQDADNGHEDSNPPAENTNASFS